MPGIKEIKHSTKTASSHSKLEDLHDDPIRPGASDRLFYLIFIKIFNHIVGKCRELVLKNALSDWSKPDP